MTTERPPTPVALVTGGAKRVGAAIAEELASRGLDIIITYNTSKDDAEAHARSLREEHKVRTWTVACDLADPDAAARTCLAAAREAGRLDVLIHNASVYFSTPLDDLDWKQARDLYAINAGSPLLITAALAPILTSSTMPGGGAVVAIADIHALGRPRKNFAAYSMSKAALAELVQTLARELAPAARANAIAPGVIAWPESGYESDAASQEAYLERVPLQRAGTPNDAAKLVAALALDHTYMNGEIVRLDGGRWLA